ncbi:MAG: YdcF family protein [SAR324 cluster bacterium]|nr:YdcF family protein [SAR324 cluster bacterium]MBL7034580.1 YdcF family protein [SAR324 cluster bacterium]
MKNWLIFLIFVFIILTTAFSQYRLILTNYAEFFTVNNATSGADAIVVLSGGKATRIPHALELFKAGYASRLLLTDEKKRNSRFAHLFSSNEDIALAMMKELKLKPPLETVTSSKGGATSTFDEAYDLLKYSQQENYLHLILVTDAFHTRRAYHAFQTVFEGTGIRLEISAAQNDIFNESNWWTSDQGISVYVLESIKYPVYLLSSRNVTFIRND